MADILLVHGSCHGAWCWRDMLAPLRALGHSPRALDLPSHGADRTPISEVTLDSYADAILDHCTPETVLVGHSMGGYSITAAAERDPKLMAQLIYVAGYVPISGKTLVEMRKMAPRQPLLEAVVMQADRKSFTIDPAKTRDLFYHDCSAEQHAFAQENLGPQPRLPAETPLQVTQAYRLPRGYVVCANDHTIPPEFQREMVHDWPAEQVRELSTSHSPFFSAPQDLAALIDHFIKHPKG